MKTNKPRVLFFDIETILMWFRAFSPGKQYLGHKQLIPGKSQHGIICISYSWLTGPVQILKWNPETGQRGLIEAFDAIAETADIVIGKNSDRFDVKMINGIRALTGMKGNPTWSLSSDDLEKQMRKYFRLPSQSLDYISSQFGLGGKISMNMDHWVKIDEYMTLLTLRADGIEDNELNIISNHLFKKNLNEALEGGLKAFNFMCFYCKKDTADTRKIWKILSSHFDSKFNYNKWNNNSGLVCKHADCGSADTYKNGTRMSASVQYQLYNCRACGRYCGRAAIHASGKEGRLI